MSEKETLSFVVTGEWVTDFIRRMFFAERQEGEYKTLDEVLEVALSCMCGSNMSENELKILATDVLLGKRKFTGRTDDDSYALVEDEENKDVDTYAEFIEDNFYMPRYTFDLVYKSLLTYQKNLEWEDKRNEMAKYSNNYGWLSPLGQFYPVEWGCHTDWAYKYLDSHPEVETKCRFSEAGDYLTSLGWILLHSPMQGEAFVTMDGLKRPTKKQRDFLYEYYTRRGNRKEAERWVNDD